MRAAQSLRALGRRAFHSSAAKRSADYEHREATHGEDTARMRRELIGGPQQQPGQGGGAVYELWNMKNRNLKMALGVGSCVGLGVAVPVIALNLQFWKAKGH
ncbi:hypothetical protein ABPG75_013767 [Micractinium tetrahymenae]